ncbi:hypothetical protein [Aliivibrio finisterrensis]|uniref:Uncharacterized protein n=1 Tax=Aliivibrio finisterrensis TaxID=511998 RepID=A0A6N6RPK0_9GAMM|nr:hypothetical protein [Aliivibrio finisterrensis]KAB2823396.1 hypothetical protein F8B77_15705 [Aliivibrio finisterrensis]
MDKPSGLKIRNSIFNMGQIASCDISEDTIFLSQDFLRSQNGKRHYVIVREKAQPYTDYNCVVPTEEFNRIKNVLEQYFL